MLQSREKEEAEDKLTVNIIKTILTLYINY